MVTRYPDAPPQSTALTADEWATMVCLNEGWTKRDDYPFQVEHGDAIAGDGMPAEIKLDDSPYLAKNQHYSIEVGERTSLRASWVRSGVLAASDAVWYVQGNPAITHKFGRNDLVG